HQRLKFQSLNASAVAAGRESGRRALTASFVRLRVPRNASSKGPRSAELLGILPRPLPKKGRASVATRKLAPLGIRVTNQRGSPLNFIGTKFNRCWQTFRVEKSQCASVCQSGMQGKFGWVTSRIHGIGRNLHKSRELNHRPNSRGAENSWLNLKYH